MRIHRAARGKLGAALAIASVIATGAGGFVAVVSLGSSAFAQSQMQPPALNYGDRTLEIAPATVPEPSAAPQPTPDDSPPPNTIQDALPYTGDPTYAAPPPATSYSRPLPYLGISVLYTKTSRGGQPVTGLQVMNVDPSSPAERAGLVGHKAMTTFGATGTTTAELLGPLANGLPSLLAKSGQLGQDGDLIVAIDDHRIESGDDLPDRLSQLNPGDIIYLTVLRQQRDASSYQTVKLPVTLASPRRTANR